MTLIGRKVILGLGFCLAFAACDDPLDLDNVPDSAAQEGVRFQAIVNDGDDPNEVSVQLELLNRRSTPRNISWGGCGIEIRLYRSDSVVYDSRIAGGVCEDIGHGAVAHPSQVRVLTESIQLSSSLAGSGRYNVVAVFDGRIDGARVTVKVRAGTLDL
jgi:hypothetical protein